MTRKHRVRPYRTERGRGPFARDCKTCGDLIIWDNIDGTLVPRHSGAIQPVTSEVEPMA